MVRLLTFALNADDRLEFGRGLSVDDEPDLWRRDYTGDIELWIDLGQPGRIAPAQGRRPRARGAAGHLWRPRAPISGGTASASALKKLSQPGR